MGSCCHGFSCVVWSSRSHALTSGFARWQSTFYWDATLLHHLCIPLCCVLAVLVEVYIIVLSFSLPVYSLLAGYLLRYRRNNFTATAVLRRGRRKRGLAQVRTTSFSKNTRRERTRTLPRPTAPHNLHNSSTRTQRESRPR